MLYLVVILRGDWTSDYMMYLSRSHKHLAGLEKLGAQPLIHAQSIDFSIIVVGQISRINYFIVAHKVFRFTVFRFNVPTVF